YKIPGTCIKKYFHTSAILPSKSSKITYSLPRIIGNILPRIIKGKGIYLYTEDGRKIIDTSSGAAVSCIGYGNNRVIKAMKKALDTGTPYLSTSFWGNNVVELLCEELINGTKGQMAKVYLCGSGSEAIEATLKLSRQFFFDQDPETLRVNFIARENSYHGVTIGALSISGHIERRAPYLPLLMKNVHHVSSCNPYRQRIEGESDAAFVTRKAAELEAKFIELGPETVIGFIAEPVVGAALGCVPHVPGYLKAMRDVCHKYGALFILDEIMCGMGRTGLGGGYQPIGAVLISEKVFNVLQKRGRFVHAQTYQSMPIQAAAALEVQKIIREGNLMDNVSKLGEYLGVRLKAVLGNHPNVGDIRGQGLFWGIEFVKDNLTKEPFDRKLDIAENIKNTALLPPYNMTVYAGTGTADGVRGDHIMLAPPYILKKKDVDHIVMVISAVIKDVFKKINS
ncbi:putative aminotransferase, partial [Lachnellula hyalina]